MTQFEHLPLLFYCTATSSLFPAIFWFFGVPQTLIFFLTYHNEKLKHLSITLYWVFLFILVKNKKNYITGWLWSQLLQYVNKEICTGAKRMNTHNSPFATKRCSLQAFFGTKMPKDAGKLSILHGLKVYLPFWTTHSKILKTLYHCNMPVKINFVISDTQKKPICY